MAGNRRIRRRDFLKTAAVMAAPIACARGNEIEKNPFPFIDGLCLDVLSEPDNIRASGLTAIIADVSKGQPIPGVVEPRWERTYAATAESIAAARLLLQQTSKVFLATNGKQIREAYEKGDTAVFLQVQGGGEIIGEELERIDLLHELGLRILQITHHENNPLGGGSMEKIPSGLTNLGRQAVEKMNALGIIPDLSHASDQTALDTLAVSKKPVIISHGAARGLVNNARCAPDEVIGRIGDSGGVMGIFMMSFWLTTDSVPSVESYVNQLRYVINIGGIDAVGVANDFPLSGEQSLARLNGNNAEAVKGYLRWWNAMAARGILGFDKLPKHVAIPEFNNIRRMRTIYETLEREKFTSLEIEKIIGANWIRVLTN